MFVKLRLCCFYIKYMQKPVIGIVCVVCPGELRCVYSVCTCIVYLCTKLTGSYFVFIMFTHETRTCAARPFFVRQLLIMSALYAVLSG